MARISENLRQQITKRALGMCEYCQTAQRIVVTLEIDHILPQAAGGETSLDNLCLVCRGCNGYKRAFLTGYDSVTEQHVALFNPRTQTWEAHFRWDDSGVQLTGLTATGRATIQRLRMNRADMILSRQIWVESGWHPPKLG